MFAAAAATIGTTWVVVSGDFVLGLSGCGVGVFFGGVFGFGVSAFFSGVFCRSGGFSSTDFSCVTCSSVLATSGLTLVGSCASGSGGRGVSSTPTPMLGSNSRLSLGGCTSRRPSSLTNEALEESLFDATLARFAAGELRDSFRAIGGSTGVSFRGVTRGGVLLCLDSTLGDSDFIGGSGGVGDFLVDGPGSSFRVRLESCRPFKVFLVSCRLTWKLMIWFQTFST